jgi:hypothetical protein
LYIFDFERSFWASTVFPSASPVAQFRQLFTNDSPKVPPLLANGKVTPVAMPATCLDYACFLLFDRQVFQAVGTSAASGLTDQAGIFNQMRKYSQKKSGKNKNFLTALIISC